MRKRFEANRWRRRYNYVCSSCLQKRTTLDHDRMVGGVCTVCEPEPQSKDQQALFPNKNDDGQQA